MLSTPIRSIWPPERLRITEVDAARGNAAGSASALSVVEKNAVIDEPAAAFIRNVRIIERVKRYRGNFRASKVTWRSSRLNRHSPSRTTSAKQLAMIIFN
jgi:hypothetical protein